MAQRRVAAKRIASIQLSKETVHLDSYAYTTPDNSEHWDVSAVLPPEDRDGAIVVGGGGWAHGHETSAGAFLTSSCPTRDLDGWIVASKDHIVGDPHQLSVYFLALRIDGMRKPDLSRLVQTFEAQSTRAEHPEVEVLVPATHAVLSGGFWVDWYGEGNLATTSIPDPDRNGWIARSKSHIKPDSAVIHAYAIGIKKALPGAVDVVQHIDSATSGRAAHPAMEVALDRNFLLTGVGAEVHWSGWGNMLTRIQPIVDDQPRPVVQKVSASAKDHNEDDPSTITVYAIGTRLPDATFNIDGTFNADNLARYVQLLYSVSW